MHLEVERIMNGTEQNNSRMKGNEMKMEWQRNAKETEVKMEWKWNYVKDCSLVNESIVECSFNEDEM